MFLYNRSFCENLIVFSDRKENVLVKKVTIRSTDLTVNPIGLGTNAVGGQKYYPGITDEDGRQFLRTALDIGVNFWDTAYTYGPKRSEEIIGEVLKETGKRHEVVLATKAAHDDSSGETVMNNRPEFLRQAVEDSLRRLQTDYIDLFYIHFPDEDTPKDEAVGELYRLKEEGKIRAIGVSNFTLEQLKEANKDGYVNVYQGLYNLFQRQAEEELFPYTVAHDISFVPYFPFASGLLAGKYTKETTFPAGDLRLKRPEFQPDQFAENVARVDRLRDVAARYKADIAHVVLQWYLRHEAIDVVIPGAKRSEQVESNVAALRVALSEEDVMAIREIFS